MQDKKKVCGKIALWGESRKLSDEILKQVYTEMTNAGEQTPVQEKKQRSGKRE
jgi:hypothetical protein